MYVVAGITGRVGSVVGSELLSRGEKVRAIVRSPTRGAAWAELGVELAVGSLDDSAFLSEALRGATGFFTLLPPDLQTPDLYARQRLVADRQRDAVARSGVGHVVLLSSLGADLPSGTGPIKGLYYFENALRGTGTRLTALRAAYFMQNVATLIPTARNDGIYPNFLPSADFQILMVATRDIGRAAAQALVSPPSQHEVVDVYGPAYSVRELAFKLGTALGRDLRIVDIPPDQHASAMMQAGLPRPAAEAYAEMYAAFAAGLIVPKGDRALLGQTTFDELLPELLGS